jgi:hypothetical protein
LTSKLIEASNAAIKDLAMESKITYWYIAKSGFGTGTFYNYFIDKGAFKNVPVPPVANAKMPYWQ